MTPAVRAFVHALIHSFQSQIAALQAGIVELNLRIVELESQVKKLTPQNSSVPPSTVHPHGKPNRKPLPGKKRKQGGQQGHKRTIRELIPSDQCDDVIERKPDACRKCGGDLELDGLNPTRHQVWELPPIKPVVIEHRLLRGHCRCCGITTQAELPEGVPTGQCGPRLAAFTGLLMGHFRQSKRRTASFLCDLLNIPCSPSWTVKIQNHVSHAISSCYEELREKLQSQAQLFVDESPTKEKNTKAWLWVAVAPFFAVFGIFGNRKRESLQALVGNYAGIILNCDRAKMYLDGKKLQWCWSHLRRDIQKLIESNDNQVKRLGNDLIRQQKLLFEHWRRYKAKETSWEEFQILARPVRDEFNSLLLRGRFSGNKKLIGFCNELYPRREHLWTFIEVQGIEPTNNTAERALRPAVIYRKLSFGTQSASGSRYLERILTISETCRLQGRNAYQFLIDAMEAKFAGLAPPSLLPSKSDVAKAA